MARATSCEIWTLRASTAPYWFRRHGKASVTISSSRRRACTRSASASLGRFDPEAPGAANQLTRWKEQPGMLGLRFTFRRPQLAAPLVEGRIDWVWAAAEKHDLPVMVMVSQSQTQHIDRIAARHPGLRFVTDHMSLTSGQKDDEAFANFENLLALAKRPNIAVKASALPCYTSETYPYRRLHPRLRQVYDAFGPCRIFWGTDISRLPCTLQPGDLDDHGRDPVADCDG
ncbi:MAG: amidohydrolase family protein [Burkholderiales bacterium]